MLPKVELCRDCPSFLTPPGYCDPVGSGVNQVLLVGSSPDKAAVQLGQAYSPYSEVGTILARACQLREMDLDQFTYTNLTWCPASPRREVLNYCAVKHLRPLIDRLKPRMIVALGPDVIRELTGITGHKTDPRYTRGFVVDGINAAAGYPVKLTYDPLMIREGNMNLLGALAQDLDMARKQERRPFRPDYKVGMEHTAEWLADAKAHPDLGIGVDIETGTSLKNDEDEVRGHSDPITQIQFSIRPGEALILPWSERAKEFTKIVMALPNPKLSWNGWLFDWPRLRAEGVEIAGQDLDLMWCLRGDTKVQLADGTSRRIDEIVENRQQVQLLGMDEQGQTIVTTVTDWHKHEVPGQQWIRIKTAGTRYSLHVTPDHKVFTNYGWKQAKDVTVGDFIPIPKRGAADVILGSLLGDGTYNKTNNSLWIGHGPKQMAYALAKANYFGVNLNHSTNHRGEETYYFSVVCDKGWHNAMYGPAGRRFVKPSTYRALAVWYMDNGSLKVHGQSGNGCRAVMCLSPQQTQQLDEVLEYFTQEFGDEFTVSARENMTANLYLRKETKQRFFDAIAQYVHPSMDYKLPADFRDRYNGWLESANDPQWAEVETVAHSLNVKGKLGRTRYCVTVDHPTHRFFTLGGLVSNCWHFLEPGLPYNLSHCVATFVGNELPPWKHTMSADLHRYGGLDVDALVRIYPRLVEALQAEGMWEAYQTFICKFWKVLKDMSDRGFPFNLEKAAELRGWVEGEKARIFADIQERIPNTLKNVHPKEGYKKKPSPKSPGFKEEEGVMWAWDKDQECWTKLETRTFGDEERWVRVKPFLVTSSDQIKRYAASKGQQLYKVKDGHKYKESTGKKELMKMAQKYGDPFYKTVVEYRELDKIAGNYLEWNVTPAGRVHCEHHFGPESGQIDTRSPNIHTIPKGTPLAKKVRACVTAGPGRKLVEIDATAFHAKTLGYCARDASYMRLSALDIHSFFAAHLLHLPDADTLLDLGDDELRDRLRWIKDNHTQIRNKKAKPALLGMGFGLGADKLYRMNEDSFENVAEAKRTIDMMKGIFPKIFDYQTQTRNLAHAQKFLKTEFGCIRRFYDVFRWDYVRGVWRSGDQAEECIAFPPANIAHCHFKLAMMRLEDRGLLEKYHLIAYIKDALIFECPESLVDECVHEVKMELEAPSTILVDPEVAPGGFAVGTEAEVGTDWSRMEHYRL